MEVSIGKGRVEKGKGEGISKNAPRFLQKLGTFLHNKNVFGTSFGYLLPENK